MSRKQRRAQIKKPSAETKAVCDRLLRQPEGKWDGVNIPDVSDIECAFPTRYRELLPPYEALTHQEQTMRGPFCEAVSMLFFKGGKLSDYGIVPKPGIDLRKVMRYLRATMGDFGPSHEHKIGGIGHALALWCDYVPAAKTGGGQ